jgi:hypothetical protein
MCIKAQICLCKLLQNTANIFLFFVTLYYDLMASGNQFQTGRFVENRLDTIGVHQMPEDNPEWDIDRMIQFLRKEEIILMDD